MILTHYLTEAEEIVMAAVWEMDHDPVMSEVYDLLREQTDKNWQTPTVSTYLRRLVQKGYLRMNHVGRDYFYEARISRETYMEAYLDRFTARWGDPARRAIARAAKKEDT